MRYLNTLLAMLLLGGCTQVFFQPHRVLVNTPDTFGVEYEPLEIRAEDGTALFSWFLPARGQAKGTVLYLHGNAENISTHFTNVAWLPAAGFSVLALDYRGYGRSGGSPSLPGVQLDIDAAMQALLARPDIEPQRIFILGQSLGAALAIHYAAHSPRRSHVRAVIADSAFSDYHRISKERLAGSWLTWPLQWLPSFAVNNDYSPEASVHALSPIPLLLIHGGEDAVVPPQHSRRLYEKAAEPKDIWLVPQAGHIQSLRSASVRKRLAEFLERHAADSVAQGRSSAPTLR